MKYEPTNYPSDLTDSQWEQIKELFPEGPNSVHHKRNLINAVLYLVDNGCKWRALPHDFPPYSTVHSFYRRARISDLWEKTGRKPGPTYALVDSQRVKTTYASQERGIDRGKKQKAEKDTLS